MCLTIAIDFCSCVVCVVVCGYRPRKWLMRAHTYINIIVHPLLCPGRKWKCILNELKHSAEAEQHKTNKKNREENS